MQSKLSSAVEITLGTAITIGITLWLETLLPYKLLVLSISLVWSTLAKYYVRRLFNWWYHGRNNEQNS